MKRNVNEEELIIYIEIEKLQSMIQSEIESKSKHLLQVEIETEMELYIEI